MSKNLVVRLSGIELESIKEKIIFDYLSDWSESDNQILITTQVVIEGVDRGWCGNVTLVGNTDDVGTDERIKNNYKNTYKDVLLVRVIKSGNQPMTFEYQFLKN